MDNSLLTTIERIYNSIKYNGFYILLSLLFPFIIWKFDAGNEIIDSMKETAFVPNMIFSITVFTALAFSVWCVPTLAIKYFLFITNYGQKKERAKGNEKNKIKLDLFQQLIFAYNGLEGLSTDEISKSEYSNKSTENKRLQIAVRYFAIAPWILFILTCIKIFLKNESICWFILVSVFVGLVYLIFLIDKRKKDLTRIIKSISGNRLLHKYPFILIRSIIMIALIAVVVFWIRYFQNFADFKYGSSSNHQLIFILLHIFSLLAFYCFLVYMENVDLPEQFSYNISNVGYKILIIFLLGCIIAFYFLNENQLIENVSPVNIIIIIAATFITFFEFLFTSQHLLIAIVERSNSPTELPVLSQKEDNSTRLRGYSYSLVGLLLMIIILYFFSSPNSHRIRVERTSSQLDIPRQSLTDYFDKWYETRHLSDTSDSVVYLISGQGGGSRAAAHFYMSMGLFEKADSNFFKKVFCISTVSGSTSGAEMFLASKYAGYQYKDTSDIKSKGIQLYGRNYMSSAFFGMMMGDGIEWLTTLNNDFPHDRNFHLQKEELTSYKNTFDTIYWTDFFESDFMHAYADTNKHWPLFLINSTLVDFGVRGIFSPVTKEFSLARDLYGEFIKDNNHYKMDIPMVTCVNQSQAFPVLSAYNYLECTGRLADGGIVENSGCATTLEVYQALRQHCNKTKKKGIAFVCINLSNSSLEENYAAPFKNASILNTVTAVMHSPFDGSQFYAHENLSKNIIYLDSFNLDINHQDTVWNFQLDDEIILSRTLSKETVARIFDTINVEGKYNYKLPFIKKNKNLYHPDCGNN